MIIAIDKRFQFETNAQSVPIARAAIAYASPEANVEEQMFLPFAVDAEEKANKYPTASKRLTKLIKELIKERRLPTTVISAIAHYLPHD